MSPKDAWTRLQGLEASVKSALALLAALSLVAVVLSRYAGLPQQVSAVELRVGAVERETADQARALAEYGKKLDRILCIIEAGESGRAASVGCAR